MNVRNKTKGYTLIEIIVVIGIMGALTALIYSSFDGSKANSRDQKRVSDISNIQLALEQYFNKNGVYPLQLDNYNHSGVLVPTYINEIPKDPSTNVAYSSNYFPMSKVPGLGNSNSCVSYQLWTRFERKNVYLDSKKSFNSLPMWKSQGGVVSNGFYECVKPMLGLHGAIDASLSPENDLVYDVMP